MKTLDGHKFRNGSTATVTGFTRDGIRLDNGWVLPADAGHFRSGFVETSFGSQGRTVQRVILAVAENSLPATNQQQMYVGASRAVERMTLYTDNKDAVRAAVPRSSLKKAALDLRPDQRKASGQRRERERQRKKRLAYIDRVRTAYDASQPRQHQPQPPHQPDRQAERQVSYGR